MCVCDFCNLVQNEEALNGEGGEEEGGEEGEEEEEEERKSSDRRPKKKAKRAEEKTGPQTFTGIGIKVITTHARSVHSRISIHFRLACCSRVWVTVAHADSFLGVCSFVLWQVAFTGVSSATHQLSGGQESVLALSLIFAIQRCDPSPFYLLDEIDSALDPVHRTAVANMLAQQSAEAQFLCTTFHPEMLSAADKFFGVVFKNKASFVSVITEDQAHELIRVVEREAEQ